MPGDRPRTTPVPPSRSPGIATALPLLSLALLGQGAAFAREQPQSAAPSQDSSQTLALASPGAPSALLPPEPAATAGATPTPLPVEPPPPVDAGLMAQARPTTTDPTAGDPAKSPSREADAPPTSDAAPVTPQPFGTPSEPTPTTPEVQTPGSLTPEVVKPQPAQSNEPRVLLSEVVIEGLQGHPERERLERAAYSAMVSSPGTEVTRSDLRKDLAAIYATGWFSDVRIEPVDSALGVRLLVKVVPNPVLTKVTLDPPDAKLPATVVQDTFAADYGKTINLNSLQTRIQELQKWYADQGYSLARVTGPSRVSPQGELVLGVRQGIVNGVEVQFLNKEGSATNDKGQPIRGKTKSWVITREISMKSGEIFNRRNLEDDIKRLYGTGLFSDVKVTLRPEPSDPGRITIVLGIVEQSTGSLSGGLGYSQSQGVFGQVQVQDSNFLGRAWDVATSFTYGQFGGLADVTFTDPWIKGDPFRTALRVKGFISRDVPQIFQSQDNGSIYTVSDFYEAPGTKVAYNTNNRNNPEGKVFSSVQKAKEADSDVSWYAFDGNSVVIQRVGGNVQVVRPLNGGNPFKRAKWNVIVGFSGQQVTPINYSGDRMPYGVSTNAFNGKSYAEKVPNDAVICIAYNCADTNQLVGVRLAATMNTLNDPRNPTKGNFFSVGTEQFISVGPDSPTFNRLRAGFTHYIPVNWLKFYKGCRATAPGETPDCKQALAFQFTAGTNIGSLPPYEAFCLGGGNSVRGYYDCDLGVGRSFGEATIEYRFPLFKIVSGELFVDGGTAFGTQKDVPGKPGELLGKPGQGFSVGTGLIVTTPVGPLRLEVASQDFTGDWRFNLGVGWKF
ncbi:MAG: BamA/TamA family outer membrane protein [Cyanobacteriota bacterium]|nr:BamA/TamA family outer membrane protein [Cyanobacteriota bacterium]